LKIFPKLYYHNVKNKRRYNTIRIEESPLIYLHISSRRRDGVQSLGPTNNPGRLPSFRKFGHLIKNDVAGSQKSPRREGAFCRGRPGLMVLKTTLGEALNQRQSRADTSRIRTGISPSGYIELVR
jgi:hypothetical protein